MTGKTENNTTRPIAPIDKQLLDACIHCGLCLPACPTYTATGREMESPRGRIYLLSKWNDGELDLTPRLSEHIDTCLGCLGCQTACPSGVQYESILNAARPYIAAQHPVAQRQIMRFSFEKVLPNYKLLHFGASLLRIWQRLNLGKALQWLAAPTPEAAQAAEAGQLVNPLRKALYRLSVWESLLPRVPEFTALPKQSWKQGVKKGAVQLFSGCVMDVFYNHVNHACLRLLRAQGKIVQVPQQTCCGALAMHAGEMDIARELARRNVELLERTEGPIVVTAAGCGAMLKHYGELLRDDAQWHERATKVAQRFLDITESLAQDSFDKPSSNDFDQRFKPSVKVAYHAACHLAHAQQVRDEPELLLQRAATAVGGGRLQLVPLREAEHCCGSAGIYNLLNTELSLQVLARKMDFIATTGAQLVVTTNPGCMLQLEYGVRQRGLEIEVMHLCELLDSIYCSP